jgi:superfamily II DNA or RNA helicase
MLSVIFEVENNSTFIVGKLPSEVYQGLRKELGYRPEDVRFIQMNSNKHWDGIESTLCYSHKSCRCAIKKQGTHFPTGLFHKAKEFLQNNGVSVTVKDKRPPVEKSLNLTLTTKVESRDYQIEALNLATPPNRERGMLQMATGAGKTLTAAQIIAKVGVSPVVFYVPSIDLLKQSAEEFEQAFLKDGKPIKIGRIGDGICDIQEINVMTTQTAIRACGVQYKIKNNDESDDIEDDFVPSDDEKEKILKLISSAKMIMADECVDGEATVYTDVGAIKLKEIPEKGAKTILSYDFKEERDQKAVSKKILKFKDQGERETLEFILSSGKRMKCTGNHPVFTTKGWKEAETIRENDFLFVFNINTAQSGFEEILAIRPSGKINVYDIEVEDTNCFFASDILVHNCQHWAASTCQVISDNSKSARYRYGISATPHRDLNDDILIDSCFGKLIYSVNASRLIENGWLVQPIIYFIKVTDMPKDEITYPACYKKGIAENPTRNQYVVDIAEKLAASGRTVLILCKQIEHGKLLSSMIPGSVFLHGGHTGKARKKHLDAIREKQEHAKITIASVIMDEGVNLKALDALILAGGGKSATRALQRVGRVLRLYEKDGVKKKDAIVIDFEDHCKYLLAHSKKRRKMYQTEPKFIIKEIDPNKK